MSIAALLPKKSLKIAQLNICSLRNKVYEITDLLAVNSINILAISETHLDDTFQDEAMGIQGYNLYRKDRNRYGGGVALYVQNHLPVKVREDIMYDEIEVLWLQINLLHTKPILVGCCYRPPSSDRQYLEAMGKMLDKVCELNMETVFTGDINIDWLSSNCPVRKQLVTITDACGLKQVVTKPTRFSTNNKGINTASCIDHIYLSADDLYTKAVSVPIGCSDHNIVVVARKMKVPKARPRVMHKRSYRGFSKEAFLEDVSNICWSKVYNVIEPDEALEHFLAKFVPVIDKHAPVRKVTVRTCRAPWVDVELKGYMSQRNQAKEKAQNSGCTKDRENYCKLRNQVTKLNQRKKKLYYALQLTRTKNDPKKLWSTLNDIMGRNTSPQPTFIENGGTFITKPKEIADHLNNFFRSKVNKLRKESSQRADSSSIVNIQDYMKDKSCQFEFSELTVETVVRLVKGACGDKQPGMDGIDGKLIRLAVDYVAQPICHILNTSLKQAIFPQAWKEAKIIPLPKDKKASFSGPNSRPISLLPALSKILEKTIFDQIQEYLSVNNLLTKYQHAYRKGHSTCTALTQMSDDWYRDLDNKMICGAVLLDFTAAFDVIEHKLLLEKLVCYGFKPSAATWMESYLMDRSQRVFFNGSYSNSVLVESGIPQGSCLGPLMYSVFTNDLPQVLRYANLSMYADDTTVYASAKTAEELTVILNRELSSIGKWVHENKMVLNLTKTKSIIFGSNQSLRAEPELRLCIEGTSIQQVKETKLLGITLDDKLSWSKHIDTIVNKMGKALAVVRRCRNHLTPDLRKLVVSSLVLSQLDYCQIVWANTTKKDMSKLQLVQNKAARFALHCPYRTSIHSMHAGLQWLKVEDRMAAALLLSTWSLLQSKTPADQYSKLNNNLASHTYVTRRVTEGRFSLPKANTNFLRRTVGYRAMKSWNLLPTEIINVTSKRIFKKQIRKHLGTANL